MMATGLDHSYDQVATGPARPGSHRQEVQETKEEENSRDELFKAVTLLVTSDGFAVQQEAVS